jgi:hypothetical protein
MRIAVYGATGRVGSHVVAEALRRGHEVTALSRHAAPTSDDATWQQGDATDAASVAQAAATHDVIVTAHGPSRAAGDDGAFLGSVRTVADAVGSTRLIVVGGAGSLFAAPGVRLVDTPGFPDAYKPEALIQAEALEILRGARPDLNWTYLSPAPEFTDGERTGSYVVAGDEPAGANISVADYAVVLVDEIERPGHPRQRFTAAN